MTADRVCLLAVVCGFFIGAREARSERPVSNQQAAALSAAERAALNRKAKRGDWQAAFALAFYYKAVEPKTRNQEYFLTLASKSGSREGIEALADFYSTPGGIFQPQVAISLRKDLKKKFPAEVDNIDWAEGCALKYHYLATADARKREATFLKLAASWGSTKAKETLRSIDARNISANETAKVVSTASKSLPEMAARNTTAERLLPDVSVRLQRNGTTAILAKFDKPFSESFDFGQKATPFVDEDHPPILELTIFGWNLRRMLMLADYHNRDSSEPKKVEGRHIAEQYTYAPPFWPYVRLEVSNQWEGDWTVIGSSPPGTDGTETVALMYPDQAAYVEHSAPESPTCNLDLTPFLEFIGKFKYGRVVLRSGGASQTIVLTDLLPPEPSPTPAPTSGDY